MMIPILNNSNDVGTTADMSRRIRATLPTGWFPVSSPPPAASASPVLDGLLSGLATAWSFCFALISDTVAQTRIATASGSFLNMISSDLLGATLPRRNGESDSSFRSRISMNLVSSRGTRRDVVRMVESLTSLTPFICEPSRAADCGVYGGSLNNEGGGALGYGVFGLRYGSSKLCFQYLVDVPSYAPFAPGVISTRQSSATYVDENLLIQLVGPFVLRPRYENGVCIGALSEPQGFNLITDSRFWSGFSQPNLSGGSKVTWLVDNGKTSLFQADPVLLISVPSGSGLDGPFIDVAAAGAMVTGSAWVFLPADLTLAGVELVMTDLNLSGSSVNCPADMTQLGRWQRLSVCLQLQAAPGRNLRMGLVVSGTNSNNVSVWTQCWQVELGVVATSYIPTSGMLGIRQRDDLVSEASSVAPASYSSSDVLQLIASVIPAATIAWTSIEPVAG